MYAIQETMMAAQRAMFTQLNILSSDLARLQKAVEAKGERRGEGEALADAHPTRIAQSSGVSRQYFSSFSTNSPGITSPSPTPPIDMKGAIVPKGALRDISDVTMYSSHSHLPSLSALSALNSLTALESLTALTALSHLSADTFSGHSNRLANNSKGQSLASLHDDAYVGSPTISYH
jgi:hypothetical protein